MQLAEKIRFSDPISNETLTDLENGILARILLKSTTSKLEIVREINGYRWKVCIYFGKCPPNRYSNQLKVSARKILYGSTLLKWIDTIEADKKEKILPSE